MARNLVKRPAASGAPRQVPFFGFKRPAAAGSDRHAGKSSHVFGPPAKKRKMNSGTQYCKSRVGTAGFSYASWRGGFYPKGLPAAKEFAHYASEFNALELNTTFYGTPSAATFDLFRGRAAAVSGAAPFLYSVKANQFFTHRKQLNVDAVFRSRWRDFWARCQRLGDHLGCVLFQFPPKFQLTKISDAGGSRTRSTWQRLLDLGALLPRTGRFAFEFRHPSWFEDPEVEVLFRRFNWCLCLVDCCNKTGWAGKLPSGSNPRPESYPITCDWGVYFRFHGPSGQYVGSYGTAVMRRFAAHLHNATTNSSLRAFAFFNNTDDGEPVASAIVDARLLRDRLRTLQDC